MRRCTWLTVSPAALALLAGCTIGNNKWQRPRDLPSAELVDRTRVLGIRLDPPEAMPGEAVVASALIPDPDGTADLRLWSACPPELATSFGCATLDEEAIIGIEPGPVPPTLVLPETALDDVSEDDKRTGIYWSVQVLAAPQELLADGADFETIDFNQVESAFKRLVVSNSEAPNQNPDATGLRVDGIDADPEVPVVFLAGQTYELELVVPEDAAEPYTFVTRDGDIEDRVEEPYGTWFATGGDYFNPFSLAPFWVVDWTAPAEPVDSGEIYVVIRDRRGGMGWYVQPFVVE